MALAALAFAAGIFLASGLSGIRFITAVCLFVLAGATAALFKQRDTLIAAAALLAGLLRAYAAGRLFAPVPDLAFFERIREALLAQTNELFGANAATISAMLWGDKSGLAYDALSAFRTAGIAHIFALSGLHVSFFAAALALLFRKSSNRLRFIITAAFVFLYCAVCAFPASLVRASVMTVCVLFAPLANRRADMLSSLSFAAIVILLFSPAQLGEAGFLMSVSAVYGIALFSRRLASRLAPIGRAGAESAALSLSASFGVLPLTVYFFKRVPVFSLPANLLMLPLVPVAVLCGFIGVLISFIWSGLGVPFVWASGFCIDALTHISGLVARLPGAMLYVPAFSPLLCGAIYAAMAVISPLCLLSAKNKAYICAALIACGFILGLVV